MKRIKQSVASAVTPLLAYALRNAALPFRRSLWYNVCVPYLAWRSHRFEIRTRYGFRFAGDSADFVPKYVYWFGVWEPTITALVRTVSLEGRSFIDVGANLGWYSLVASPRVGPSCRVIAIEPSPVLLSGLQDNIALNGFKNIRVVPKAAWREEAILDLRSGPSDNLGQTTLMPDAGTWAVATGASHRVSAAPLSSLLTPEEVATAAVLKIDVEGAETEVLRGCLDVLPGFPSDVKLLMELTPDEKGNHHWIIDTMLRAGFRMFTLENEYSADFYLSPRSLAFTEVSGEFNRQIDVVFSRRQLS